MRTPVSSQVVKGCVSVIIRDDVNIVIAVIAVPLHDRIFHKTGLQLSEFVCWRIIWMR